MYDPKAFSCDYKKEAWTFFILDAACDAANAAFMMKHGPNAFATDPEELRKVALQGLDMTFHILTLPTHPMQLRPKLEAKVKEYIKMIIGLVAKKREQQQADRLLLEEQRKREAEAEREMEAERARQAAKHAAAKLTLHRVIILISTLLAFAAAWGFGGGGGPNP